RLCIDWGVDGLGMHAPDLAVFEGVPEIWSRQNEVLRVAEVGARPGLVIEVTWDITRDIDLDDKVLHYHRAGVPFYAIVDTRPGEAHPRVRLIGYRWSPDGYVRVAPDPSGRLWLEAVRLWLAGEGNALVCYDQRGRRVPTYQELLKTFQA